MELLNKDVSILFNVINYRLKNLINYVIGLDGVLKLDRI